MRYIRTKDGIYDLEKSLFHQYNGIRVLTPYCKQYEENPSLCKTADTIEELCDEFVIKNEMADKEYNHLVYSYDNWKHYIYCGDSDEVEVPYEGQPLKGAIWTCNGLIYVAGIGTDGKWELLDSIQST